MAYHLSVFVVNEPGKLEGITRALSEKGLNIRAISMASTGEFGVVRVLVNDPDRGLEALKESRFTVTRRRILVALIDSLSLEQVPYIESLLHIARHHHECWDGRGYPDGLAGERIPPEARIIKVADAFDALTSRRCYKEAWNVEKAARFLRESAGTQFDPRCVEVLLSQDREIVGIMSRFVDESSEAAS